MLAKALFFGMLSNPLTAVKYVLSTLATHTYRVTNLEGLIDTFTKILRTRAFHGSLMFGDQDFCFETLGVLGGVEIKLTSFMIRELRGDDVFYDIGAHIGFYTVLASKMLEKGWVYAFEPNPYI